MTLLETVNNHPVIVVLLGLGALAASPVVGTVLNTARSLLGRAVGVIGNFFFVTMRMEDEAAAAIVLLYLRENCQSFSMGEEHYDNKGATVRKLGYRTVFYKFLVKSLTLFIYDHAPLLVTPVKGAGEKKQQTTIRFLRGTIDFAKLLTEAAEFSDAHSRAHAAKHRSFQIIKISGGGKDKDDFKSASGGMSANGPYAMDREPVNFTVEQLEPEPVASALATLSATPVHEELIRDVTFWKNNRKWYGDRGLTWKRGYLIFGQPGTGKTSLIRALAQDLDIPICIFNLASMQESQFPGAWEHAKMWTPRIILLEDFDTVFKGRENQNKWSTLTFSTVLNAIDGVEQSSGTLLFITTNKVDDIDEALGRPNVKGESTRPGRVDVVLEIPPLDTEGRYKIAMRVLRDEPVARKLAEEHGDDTPSQFTERCKRAALEVKWSEHESKLPKVEIKFAPTDPNFKEKEVEPKASKAEPESKPLTGPSVIDRLKDMAGTLMPVTTGPDGEQTYHRQPGYAPPPPPPEDNPSEWVEGTVEETVEPDSEVEPE